MTEAEKSPEQMVTREEGGRGRWGESGPWEEKGGWSWICSAWVRTDPEERPAEQIENGQEELVRRTFIEVTGRVTVEQTSSHVHRWLPAKHVVHVPTQTQAPLFPRVSSEGAPVQEGEGDIGRGGGWKVK